MSGTCPEQLCPMLFGEPPAPSSAHERRHFIEVVRPEQHHDLPAPWSPTLGHGDKRESFGLLRFPRPDDMGREFRIAHGKIMPSLHGISRSQARSSFDWPGMVAASSQPSWYRSSYWASKIVSDFRSGRDSGDYDKEWAVDCISDLIHNESTEELQFENTKRV